MIPIISQKYKSYSFGSLSELSHTQKETLARIFDRPNVETDAILGGRGSIKKIDLEGFGPVVIKYNTRGGFIRLFIERTYARVGKTCNRIEYEQLLNASKIGVNVPEPVAFATKGLLFYRGWLVLKEIKNSETLVEVSLKDKARVDKLLNEIARQITILIDSCLYHVDLHPGNILVTDNDQIFIIDFHKARIFNGSRQKLLNKYSARWKRAIKKHGLPEMLNNIFEKVPGKCTQG
ncbi:MAG: lipopolysaccharide kinase InaA family protein [Desulfobacteraceae bacterium]|jgi:3-deoxy-D-manno-octulosonic acid kinase